MADCLTRREGSCLRYCTDTKAVLDRGVAVAGVVGAGVATVRLLRWCAVGARGVGTAGWFCFRLTTVCSAAVSWLRMHRRLWH